jgi:hypothetical protein
MYEDLLDYGLSHIWCLIKDRKVKKVAYWNPIRKQCSSIARIIADAGIGQSVVHADGNPLNLRASNLVIGKGKGTRRDREDLGEQSRFTYRNILNHIYEDTNIKELNNE